MTDVTTVFLEDMQVGQTVESLNIVTPDVVRAFADVSGDVNPLHIDPDFAATTRFGQCIAHGMLSASFISAILGTKMPGVGAIYLSQSVTFKAPVMVGSTVRTVVRVEEINRSRVRMSTNCYVGDTQVIEGEAVVMAPKKG